jgi:hypothetical protein
MIREKISSANRRKVFMELCSEAAFDELERGGVDGLMKWMREKFPDMK